MRLIALLLALLLAAPSWAAYLTTRDALTSAATGDLLYIHDVSDTTDDAGGTSKRITMGNILAWLAGQAWTPTGAWNFGGAASFEVPNHTYANLPGTPATGMLALVTDCNTNACTAGGGETPVLMAYTGAAWAPVTPVAWVNQDVTSDANPSFATINVVGTNSLNLGTASSATGQVVWKNSTNANTFTIQPGATGANLSWTLPTAAAGGNDYAIVSNASGVLSYLDTSGLGGDDLGSAAYTDVVALWTTCTGYLKSDGSCDTPAGGGDVLVSGTPTDGQIAIWTSADTIEGVDSLSGVELQGVVGDAGTLAVWGADSPYTLGNASALSGVVLLTSGVPSAADLDDLPDGSTYQRVAASDVDANGHVNLVQDSDGTGAVQFTGVTATRALTLPADEAATLVTSASLATHTGTVTGAVRIVSKGTAYTLGTDAASEAYGGVVIGTAAMVLTLPSAAAGMSFCFLAGQGVAAVIQVTPGASDYLVVDGVRGTAATALASAGGPGDKLCAVAADATDWYVTGLTGTWAE